jgi:hypothetical protein
MPFCVAFDKSTGQILSTVTGTATAPVVPDDAPYAFGVFEDWKETIGQRVNLAAFAAAPKDLACIEPCPVFARDEERGKILMALDAIDKRHPRAVRDSMLKGDNSSLQKLEDEAAVLRSQLAGLPALQQGYGQQGT